MKKLICGVAIAATCMLVGCGNISYGMGNFTFNHVHISDNINGYCATIKRWHDDEQGVELHTEEFGNVFCSEGTYTLFENMSKCPYCN